VLVPDIQAGILLKQRPVLLQCADIRGIMGCADACYMLVISRPTLRDAASAKLASTQSSRCWPCPDCANTSERLRHGILHAKLSTTIHLSQPI